MMSRDSRLKGQGCCWAWGGTRCLGRFLCWYVFEFVQLVYMHVLYTRSWQCLYVYQLCA